MTLTADGAALAERCGAAMAEIQASVGALRDYAAELRGPLRVIAPQYACNAEFGPMLLDFAARHPGLELDFRLTNGMPDLIEDNIDLAFQLSPLSDGRHVARRLWDIAYALCVAADSPISAPAHPRELASLPTVLTPVIVAWQFDGDGGATCTVSPRRNGARVDDLGLGLHAVLASLGVEYLPRGLVALFLGNSAREVSISGWAPATRQFYALYPPARKLSPKVRALIAFALQARARHPAG